MVMVFFLFCVLYFESDSTMSYREKKKTAKKVFFFCLLPNSNLL